MSGRRDRQQGPKRNVETFVSGLIVTAVFGTLLRVDFIPGSWNWVFLFPMIFGGIFPMVKGFLGMVRGGVSRVVGAGAPEAAFPGPAERPVDSKTEAERKILLLAREEGGVVTPAIAALKTDLSLDRAGELLEDLARRGHAGMQVMEDGRVVYRFPEFERPDKALPGA